MAKKKTSRSPRIDVKKLQDFDIKHAKINELRTFVKQARQLYAQREKQFAREWSRYTYSPALENIREYYEENPQKSIGTQKKSELQIEAYRLKDFMNAKTATVKGAREVMRKQDIMLFGENEQGKPNYKMSYTERTNFWSVYEEFLLSKEATTFNYREVMNKLAEMRKDIKSIRDLSSALPKLLSQLKTRLEGESANYEPSGTIYRGGANN